MQTYQYIEAFRTMRKTNRSALEYMLGESLRDLDIFKSLAIRIYRKLRVKFRGMAGNLCVRSFSMQAHEQARTIDLAVDVLEHENGKPVSPLDN
jgi:hypothetical protein